jgi:hypothetical protein
LRTDLRKGNGLPVETRERLVVRFTLLGSFAVRLGLLGAASHAEVKLSSRNENLLIWLYLAGGPVRTVDIGTELWGTNEGQSDPGEKERMQANIRMACSEITKAFEEARPVPGETLPLVVESADNRRGRTLSKQYIWTSDVFDIRAQLAQGSLDSIESAIHHRARTPLGVWSKQPWATRCVREFETAYFEACMWAAMERASEGERGLAGQHVREAFSVDPMRILTYLKRLQAENDFGAIARFRNVVDAATESRALSLPSGVIEEYNRLSGPSVGPGNDTQWPSGVTGHVTVLPPPSRTPTEPTPPRDAMGATAVRSGKPTVSIDAVLGEPGDVVLTGSPPALTGPRVALRGTLDSAETMSFTAYVIDLLDSDQATTVSSSGRLPFRAPLPPGPYDLTFAPLDIVARLLPGACIDRMGHVYHLRLTVQTNAGVSAVSPLYPLVTAFRSSTKPSRWTTGAVVLILAAAVVVLAHFLVARQTHPWVWSIEPGGALSQPVVYGGDVYLWGGDKVYARDAVSGADNGSFATRQDSAFCKSAGDVAPHSKGAPNSPTVFRGIVYVTGCGGHTYALSAATRNRNLVSKPVWNRPATIGAGLLSGPVAGPQVDLVLSTGQVTCSPQIYTMDWRTGKGPPPLPDLDAGGGQNCPPPLLASAGRATYLVTLRGGAKVVVRRAGSLYSSHPVVLQPSRPVGRLVVLTGQSALAVSTGSDVWALFPSRLARPWQLTFLDPAKLLFASRSIVIIAVDGVADTSSGQMCTLGRAHPGRLCALDPTSRRQLWCRPVSNYGSLSGATTVGRRVVITSETQDAQVRDLRSGRWLRNLQSGPVDVQPAANRQLVFLSTAAKRLEAFRVE